MHQDCELLEHRSRTRRKWLPPSPRSLSFIVTEDYVDTVIQLRRYNHPDKRCECECCVDPAASATAACCANKVLLSQWRLTAPPPTPLGDSGSRHSLFLLFFQI